MSALGRRRKPPAEPPSPWAVAGTESEEPDLEPRESPVVVERAPVHAPVRPALPQLHRVDHPPVAPAALTWVSAHGGAGASSLAAGSGIGLPLTRSWPDPTLGWPSDVAVVCRSNAAGLEAGAELLAVAAAGQVPDLTIAALVVVADSPTKLPRPLRSRIRELSGVTPLLVQLGWISAWRETPYTHEKAAAAAANKVIKTITEGDRK